MVLTRYPIDKEAPALKRGVIPNSVHDDIRFEPVPDPKNSGIGALQRIGAVRRPAELFGREASVPGTGTLREGYHIPETILNCDKSISVPAMKTHTCGTTLVWI